VTLAGAGARGILVGMDRFEPIPAARTVPRQPFALTRAIAARGVRAVRRTWRRIAQQVLILSLTAIGFLGVLGLTLVMARQAITIYPVTCTPAPQPMVIYFMPAPPSPPRAARPVRAERPAPVVPSSDGAHRSPGLRHDVSDRRTPDRR
jgi:hypothetical protein